MWSFYTGIPCGGIYAYMCPLCRGYCAKSSSDCYTHVLHLVVVTYTYHMLWSVYTVFFICCGHYIIVFHVVVIIHKKSRPVLLVVISTETKFYLQHSLYAGHICSSQCIQISQGLVCFGHYAQVLNVVINIHRFFK